MKIFSFATAISVSVFCIFLTGSFAANPDDKYIVFNTFTNAFVVGKDSTARPIEYFQNKVLESSIDTMPEWLPEQDLPPLSIEQAMEIARNYLKIKKPRYANAKVDLINIYQFLCPDYYPNKWWYNIIYNSSGYETLSVVVMMDGTVNEPVVRSQ